MLSKYIFYCSLHKYKTGGIEVIKILSNSIRSTLSMRCYKQIFQMQMCMIYYVPSLSFSHSITTAFILALLKVPQKYRQELTAYRP